MKRLRIIASLLLFACGGLAGNAETESDDRWRAIQELALEHGIIDRVKSYDELVDAFHQENQRRARMKERGEIFYGPVRFRKEVWFEVWYEQLSREIERHTPARPAGRQ
jgi:hypothetical protein